MDNGKKVKNGIYSAAFVLLTLLCWCPIGYGTYGPVPMVLGMPSWAVTALLIGAFMFALEAFYLFGTDLTLKDEELPDMIKTIRKDIH